MHLVFSGLHLYILRHWDLAYLLEGRLFMITSLRFVYDVFTIFE